MRNHIHTDAAQGFDLPAAVKSRAHGHDHMIAIASLIASVSVAAITGAQMIFG